MCDEKMIRVVLLLLRKSLHSKYAYLSAEIAGRYGAGFTLAGYANAAQADVWELSCQVCLRQAR